MNYLTNNSIKKLSNLNVYSNYPFSINFAEELVLAPDAVVFSWSLEKLIPNMMGENRE